MEQIVEEIRAHEADGRLKCAAGREGDLSEDFCRPSKRCFERIVKKDGRSACVARREAILEWIMVTPQRAFSTAVVFRMFEKSVFSQLGGTPQGDQL